MNWSVLIFILVGIFIVWDAVFNNFRFNQPFINKDEDHILLKFWSAFIGGIVIIIGFIIMLSN